MKNKCERGAGNEERRGSEDSARNSYGNSIRRSEEVGNTCVGGGQHDNGILKEGRDAEGGGLKGAHQAMTSQDSLEGNSGNGRKIGRNVQKCGTLTLLCVIVFGFVLYTAPF